jgi:hypothetical protein
VRAGNPVNEEHPNAVQVNVKLVAPGKLSWQIEFPQSQGPLVISDDFYRTPFTARQGVYVASEALSA